MAFTFSNEGNRYQGAGGGVGAAVSARKLAASLWQLAATTDSGGDVRWQCGLSGGLGFEFCSATLPKSSMEGVTKWDYGYSKVSSDVNHLRIHANISVASPRQAGPFKEQKCINELKADQGGSSRTRLKSYTKKHDEEGAPRMTTEDEEIRAAVKEFKDDARRARKNCKKMYAFYSKLLSDIDEAKSSAKKFVHNYEKEMKARELLEDLCIEQAKELEACKAEMRELRNQCAGIQREVAEERRMLQMAEAWREERAQMKLVDAKLILEDKYSQMNNLIADLNALLRSSNFAKDANEIMSDAKEFAFMNPEAYDDSGRKSVQSNILIGSDYVSEDASGKETMSQVDNVADHACHKADSNEFLFVSSKQ